MFIKEYKLLDSYEPWPLDIPKERALFFDIETTGLSPKYSHLYIIGCGYYKENHWYIKQWFVKNSSEEFLMLEQFLAFSQYYDTLITYNGTTFDIPYVREKVHGYLLNEQFPKGVPIKNTLDLFRSVKPYQTLFHLSTLHQRDVENFLGLHRQDVYNGKELIKVYENFRKHPSAELLNTLLLHNKEDISGMLSLLGIFPYIRIFEGNYRYLHGSLQDDLCRLAFSLPIPVPREITYQCPHLQFYTKNDTLIVTLPVKENKLKYYFPDYEKYVILPEEHTILPKQMAKSTSIKKAIPATLETCYQELPVTGRLLSNEKKMHAIVYNALAWLLRYLAQLPK